jgi:hypothetical protein
MFFLGRYENSLKSQLNSVDGKLAEIEQKRNKKDEALIKLTKDRLALISNLVKNHTYWSQAFSWLENMLQTDIQVDSLSFDPKDGGKLFFSGFAKNYSTIARQVAAFLTDPRVSDVQLGKMATTIDGTVEFDMELAIDFEKIVKK